MAFRRGVAWRASNGPFWRGGMQGKGSGPLAAAAILLNDVAGHTAPPPPLLHFIVSPVCPASFY